MIICVQDGTDKIEFSYFVAPEKTFDDIKEDIYKHIMKKNLVDNWTETEETKVQRGGKVFTKGAHAFSKLGVAPKTTFTLIRTFPGGSLWSINSYRIYSLMLSKNTICMIYPTLVIILIC